MAVDVGLYAGFLILALLFQGAAIWVSVRAKPIGDRPYRWGTYVAILTGMMGLMFFVSTLFVPTQYSTSDISEQALAAMIGMLSVLTAFGLLRRLRFGIVMFVAACVLMIIAFPIGEVISKQPFTAQGQAGWVITILPAPIMLATTGYFKKRWRLMR